MPRLFKGLTGSWLWRSAALLALVLLPFQAISAANDSATITLFAPKAPTGAIAVVQYQNPSGQWFDVTGWQATLNKMTGADVPYQQWTVDKAQFGQGPFRWMVYAADGKTPWAISDIFSLPPGGGIERTVTIRPDNQVTTDQTVKTAVGEAAVVPVLKGGSAVWGVPCTSCDSHAQITAYISGVPATSWVAVQWLDGFGTWQTVPGWQGTAHFLYDKGELKDWTPTGTGALFLQWSVLPANYGQGPFRWAVFSGPDGTLLAVSPNFNMPKIDGVNQIMTLSG